MALVTCNETISHVIPDSNPSESDPLESEDEILFSSQAEPSYKQSTTSALNLQSNNSQSQHDNNNRVSVGCQTDFKDIKKEPSSPCFVQATEPGWSCVSILEETNQNEYLLQTMENPRYNQSAAADTKPKLKDLNRSRQNTESKMKKPSQPAASDKKRKLEDLTTTNSEKSRKENKISAIKKSKALRRNKIKSGTGKYIFCKKPSSKGKSIKKKYRLPLPGMIPLDIIRSGSK